MLVLIWNQTQIDFWLRFWIWVCKRSKPMFLCRFGKNQNQFCFDKFGFGFALERGRPNSIWFKRVFFGLVWQKAIGTWLWHWLGRNRNDVGVPNKQQNSNQILFWLGQTTKQRGEGARNVLEMVQQDMTHIWEICCFAGNKPVT